MDNTSGATNVMEELSRKLKQSKNKFQATPYTITDLHINTNNNNNNAADDGYEQVQYYSQIWPREDNSNNNSVQDGDKMTHYSPIWPENKRTNTKSKDSDSQDYHSYLEILPSTDENEMTASLTNAKTYLYDNVENDKTVKLFNKPYKKFSSEIRSHATETNTEVKLKKQLQKAKSSPGNVTNMTGKHTCELRNQNVETRANISQNAAVPILPSVTNTATTSSQVNHNLQNNGQNSQGPAGMNNNNSNNSNPATTRRSFNIVALLQSLLPDRSYDENNNQSSSPNRNIVPNVQHNNRATSTQSNVAPARSNNATNRNNHSRAGANNSTNYTDTEKNSSNLLKTNKRLKLILLGISMLLIFLIICMAVAVLYVTLIEKDSTNIVSTINTDDQNNDDIISVNDGEQNSHESQSNHNHNTQSSNSGNSNNGKTNNPY